MAVPPSIRDQAYKLFTQEVPDLLQTIESDLLTLRHDRSPTKIHNLMRTSHSIKGGAASVGLEVIATLAHRLENIFKALYSEALEIDINLETQLLQAYDCLRLPLMRQVLTGGFDTEQALAVAAPIFAQLEEQLGDILKQIEHYDVPTSAQLGVDMTLTILEVDMLEQLERLSNVIASRQNQQIEEELQLQTEIFIELAEILNKPGLGVIAEVALKAVQAHPDQALQVAQLALIDFQAYREALLASNGGHEIEPSAALLALAEDRSQRSCSSQPPTEHAGNTNDTATWIDTEEIPIASTFTTASQDIIDPRIVNHQFMNEGSASTTEKEISEETLRALFSHAEATAETEPFPSNSLSQIIEMLEEVQHQNTETVEFSEEPGSSSLVVRSTDPTAQVLPAQPLKQVSTKINQEEIPVAPSVTARVEADQLEQMNNLVNEAVIKRSSISLQNEQMQKSIRDLLNRFAAVEKIATQLRKVSDQTLIPNLRQGYQSTSDSTYQPDEIRTIQADFDALEMDNYGTLHSLLQRFLEDMIQLRESIDDIALFARRSDKNLTELRKSLTHLQDDFMWVRMLPIGEVLNRFPRILRDLSITYQKPVRLQLSGTEVLVDRAIIERIYDPLLHLLRNAFDHGIEFPDMRRQRGKPEEGLIEIKAFHRGGQTIIEVRDDGQGLNLERISRRAAELGLLPPQQVGNISNDRLFNLIFEPGFSTARKVSELSGRGVGLDVVRTQLSYLKGTISVTSQPGLGTTFTLRLPLTLTSDRLLVCLAGFTTLALPSDSIKEILVPRSDQVIKVGGQWFLQWRKEVAPIYRLSDLLEYAGPVPDFPSLGNLTTSISPSDTKHSDIKLPPFNETQTLLVISWRQKFAALEVNQLITEQKLVIKPFGSIIAPPICAYGCTILGDGSVIPVVDGAALLDEALDRNAGTARFPILPLPAGSYRVTDRDTGLTHSNQSLDAVTTRSKPSKTPKILVVDDAVALRQTLMLTLERAGYRVLQAGDGWEALRQLQLNPDVDLVISDIEMPNMNGFDFMNHRRQDPALESVPLVILTSRSNDKHRRLAMHLGATAYFTKPYVEQGFLKAIDDIIRQYRVQSS